MDSIYQEIRGYYGDPEPTAYVPGLFYIDERVMPPSSEQHDILSLSQLSEADYAPPPSFNQTPSSPSYFSVSFLLDDSQDLTASPEHQPDPPVQHSPINAQLYSPVHELLHQSPRLVRQQPDSPVQQQVPIQVRAPSPLPVNPELVHQSPRPVRQPHVPIQQHPQMLPVNVQETARIIEGYKASQKLAIGQYLFNKERKVKEKQYWKCVFCYWM